MRILASHIDSASGHTYAVIVNPIAGGLGGLPARRYRLIRALSPTWIQEVNTALSVSRTRGIAIYEEFDCLEAWKDHATFVSRVNRFKQEAHQLANVISPRSQK